MFRTLFTCALVLLASTAEADTCSFELVRSTLGEVTSLYLEQQASDKAIDAAKSPEEFLIVIPRGVAASARRAAERHRLATSECSSDAANIAGFVAVWFESYERLYTGKADAGRRLLLGEIEVAEMKVVLAENIASVDAHWKDLPKLVLAVSLATVGSDPARPNGTALNLTEEQKQKLLSGIESDCVKLGGCSNDSGNGIPAGVVAQRLMREHLRKPWALNGAPLK